MSESNADGFQYVTNSRIIVLNLLVQLGVIMSGVLQFIGYTIYFRYSRWKNTRVPEDYPILHRVINAEALVAHADAENPSHTVEHHFDGLCCGCGRAADLILFPCFHATCCCNCGMKASHCPYCNAVVTGYQRLHFVA